MSCCGRSPSSMGKRMRSAPRAPPCRCRLGCTPGMASGRRGGGCDGWMRAGSAHRALAELPHWPRVPCVCVCRVRLAGEGTDQDLAHHQGRPAARLGHHRRDWRQVPGLLGGHTAQEAAGSPQGRRLGAQGGRGGGLLCALTSREGGAARVFRLEGRRRRDDLCVRRGVSQLCWYMASRPPSVCLAPRGTCLI